MGNCNTTIIISCAGMGSRLGLGIPKALVEVDGKPLIIRQLEILHEYDDIRIVVGYQAEKVISVVTEFRKDVTFVYNYDYQTTGTAASFSKGLSGAREYVVALDGDLLVEPNDLIGVVDSEQEAVGGCEPSTDNPVLMTLDADQRVIEFSREHGTLEWTGLAKLKTSKLTPGSDHVYQMIEPIMPVKVVLVNTREIDTMHDYENAVAWVKNGYR